MFFCKHIEKLAGLHRKSKAEDELSCAVFDSADEVDKEHWNEVLKGRNLYLDVNYLKILDNISPKNFQPRYVIVYKHAFPFAIAYFQVIDFKAEVFGDLLDNKINKLKTSHLVEVNQKKRKSIFQRELNKADGYF